MKKIRSNTKGAEAIGQYGMEGINAECKSCIYYKGNKCKGQFNLINPCIFSRHENDNQNKWINY